MYDFCGHQQSSRLKQRGLRVHPINYSVESLTCACDQSSYLWFSKKNNQNFQAVS